MYESYKLKFDISEETVFEPDEYFASKFSSKITRSKSRSSYELIPGGIRLDITKVNMSDESRTETITYEIELELLALGNLDSWINEISSICKLIQDTKIIYSKEEYRTLVSYINRSLTGKDNEENPDILMPGLLVQAKNLKFHHITGDHFSKYNYRITIKADGIRKMLVYYNTSFYLVMSPSEINKIIIFNNDIFTGLLDGLVMEGELITKDRKRETYVGFELGEYFYLIFDLLRIKSEDQIQKKSHTERLSIARYLLDGIRIKSNTVNDILFNGLITIQVKDFRFFNTSEDLFRTVRDLEIDKISKYYKDDGYIIMPDNVSYDRLGKSGVDILKWKPFNKLTIDLAISWKGSPAGMTLSVYTYSYKSKFISIDIMSGNLQLRSSIRDINIVPTNIKYGDITFNVYYPSIINLNGVWKEIISKNSLICRGKYNGENYVLNIESESQKSKVMSSHELQSRISKNQDIVLELRPNLTGKIIIVDIYSSGSYVSFNKVVESKSESLNLSGYPTFTVVEFSWDSVHGSLSPVLIRKDKELPNEKNVADDIWESIINPIELDTLMGNSTQLLRKYHNRIKKRLLTGEVKGIPFIGGNLLDLGSGAGGDVTKWKKYDKIICVEPHFGYVPELIRRIKETYGFEAKVYKSQVESYESIDKIVVLNTGAEDHELISYHVNKFFNGRCNVISSMLSLSFFWGKDLKSSYQGLIKTVNKNLAKGGYFIYLTIDGDLITQLFDPLLKGPSIKSLNLLGGKISLEYNGEDKQLYIDLPGSVTVSKQTESLVFLDDLRLSLMNYKDIGWYRADQELYMNTSERMLSSLYSYGGFLKE